MALIKMNCYYCGVEVLRRKKIIAPVCEACQNKKENVRLYQCRREAMMNDESGAIKKRILEEHKKYRDDHDYADRSQTLFPRRRWSEGEKMLIAERAASDDELAQTYRVSITAIRAVRLRMNGRQSVLLAEENKREIERRGGVGS